MKFLKNMTGLVINFILANKNPLNGYIEILFWDISVQIFQVPKSYQSFVNARANKQYESPLEEVVSSTLLGSTEFIDFIKEK